MHLEETTFLILDAELLAREAHGGQRDRDDSLHIDHVERVAAMVPQDCKRVAWLHDVLEDTDLSIPDLELYGVPRVERDALRLLTRPEGAIYYAYVAAIAVAEGEAGRIARTVKEADLVDNLTRCLKAEDHMADRYRTGLHCIQGAILRG